MRLPGYENCAANRGRRMADGGVTSARSKPGLRRPMGVWRAEPDLPSVSKPTAITLDLKDEVWMTRTLYAACVAGALALAPVAASAQYVTYGAYPYCADPMPRRTRPMPTASTGRRPTPMPIPRPRARPGDTHTGTASTRQIGRASCRE